MIARIDAKSPSITLRNGKYQLCFELANPLEGRKMIAKLIEDKISDVVLTIEKPYDKRSLQSNRLLWKLCTEIANSISTDMSQVTKNEVYRRAIKEVGNYTPMPIKSVAVEEFDRIWSSNGEGWFIVDMGKSKIEDYRLIFAYAGTSTYNTIEMSRVINYLMEEANQLGLDVMSESEKALLEELSNDRT